MFKPIQALINWFRAQSQLPRTSSSHLVLFLVRGVFGAILIGLALVAFSYYYDPPRSDLSKGLYAFFGILGGGFLVLMTDILVRDKQITTVSAIYFGLLLGLLLGNILSTAIDPFIFAEPVDPHLRKGVTLLITVLCCYISISTLLQTKDEFRFIIPYVEFSRQVKGARPLVLDTSVIIDGRIADICDTRFVDTKLIVPRFVLQELQSVADSSDKLKRNRGRRGLDMLKRMQSNPKV